MDKFLRIKTNTQDDCNHYHAHNDADHSKYDKRDFYELKFSNKVRIIDRKLDQLYKYVDKVGIKKFAIAIDKFDPDLGLESTSKVYEEMQRCQYIINFGKVSFLVEIK